METASWRFFLLVSWRDILKNRTIRSSYCYFFAASWQKQVKLVGFWTHLRLRPPPLAHRARLRQDWKRADHQNSSPYTGNPLSKMSKTLTYSNAGFMRYSHINDAIIVNTVAATVALHMRHLQGGKRWILSETEKHFRVKKNKNWKTKVIVPLRC